MLGKLLKEESSLREKLSDLEVHHAKSRSELIHKNDQKEEFRELLIQLQRNGKFAHFPVKDEQLKLEIEALKSALNDLDLDESTLKTQLDKKESIQEQISTHFPIENDDDLENEVKKMEEKMRKIQLDLEIAKNEKKNAESEIVEAKNVLDAKNDEMLNLLKSESKIDIDGLISSSIMLHNELQSHDKSDKKPLKSSSMSNKNKMTFKQAEKTLNMIKSGQNLMHEKQKVEFLQKLSLGMLETLQIKELLINAKIDKNRTLGLRLTELAKLTDINIDDEHLQQNFGQSKNNQDDLEIKIEQPKLKFTN